MSLLPNPGFEESRLYWAATNHAPNVTYAILNSPSVARSGDNVLCMRTSVPGGSIAQDAVFLAPSVSCFAWIRAATIPVMGALAMWQLNTSRNLFCKFSAGQQWQLITNTLSLTAVGRPDLRDQPRPIRIEFYLETVNADLYIDSVNAF